MPEETRLAHCSKIVGDLRVMLPLLIALFGGTVYGNSETVKRWVHGTKVKEPVDQIQKPTDQPLTPEEQRTRAINRLIDEQEKIKLDIKKLQARSSSSDGSLQRQITKWHGTDTE